MKTKFLFWLASLCALPNLALGFELSIDITHLPSETYGEAVEIIVEAGATATSLSLFWDDLEPEAGLYQPEFDWPTIANAYYPGANLDLTLTFSVIDTVTDRRPSALQHLDWDDPALIAAFTRHLDQVMSRMPDVTILSVSIGNEVDGILRTEDEIKHFSHFLAASRRVIERWRPGVPVSTKLTYSGLTSNPNAWKPVLRESTGLHVTYYPIGHDFAVRGDLDVSVDLATLQGIAGTLPIFILEAGFPSSGCGAGDGGQLLFVQDLFDAGARHDSLRLISLTWLTDIPEAQVDAYTGYYGVRDACFRSFLDSLGLRDRSGNAKSSLNWLFQRL